MQSSRTRLVATMTFLALAAQVGCKPRTFNQSGSKSFKNGAQLLQDYNFPVSSSIPNGAANQAVDVSDPNAMLAATAGSIMQCYVDEAGRPVNKNGVLFSDVMAQMGQAGLNQELGDVKKSYASLFYGGAAAAVGVAVGTMQVKKFAATGRKIGVDQLIKQLNRTIKNGEQGVFQGARVFRQTGADGAVGFVLTKASADPGVMEVAFFDKNTNTPGKKSWTKVSNADDLVTFLSRMGANGDQTKAFVAAGIDDVTKVRHVISDGLLHVTSDVADANGKFKYEFFDVKTGKRVKDPIYDSNINKIFTEKADNVKFGTHSAVTSNYHVKTGKFLEFKQSRTFFQNAKKGFSAHCNKGMQLALCTMGALSVGTAVAVGGAAVFQGDSKGASPSSANAAPDLDAISDGVANAAQQSPEITINSAEGFAKLRESIVALGNNPAAPSCEMLMSGTTIANGGANAGGIVNAGPNGANSGVNAGTNGANTGVNAGANTAPANSGANGANTSSPVP